MTAKPLSLDKKLLIILLVLALHSTIVLILFKDNLYVISDQQEKKLMELLNNDEHEYDTHEQWASTKAAASQLGAPVIFQDTHHDDDDYELQKDESTTMQNTTQLDEPTQNIATDNTIDTKQENEIEKDAITQPATQMLEIPEASIPTEPLQKKHELTQTTEKVQPTKKHTPTQRIASPIQKKELEKKALNLADITRGYLEQLKNEGNHLVNVIGDSTKRPTDEQIKYERYWAKIQWCIQNSLKIHRTRYDSPQPVQTTVKMFFKVERSGAMKDLSLAQSSGITGLDQFMLFVFQDAASSFPPLPSFIKEEPYPIVFTVDVMPQTSGPIQFTRR